MSPDCHADIPSHSVLMHGIKDALRLWGAVAWPPMSEVYIVHLREHGMQATGIPGCCKAAVRTPDGKKPSCKEH